MKVHPQNHNQSIEDGDKVPNYLMVAQFDDGNAKYGLGFAISTGNHPAK
jgi:hypothetical protein